VKLHSLLVDAKMKIVSEIAFFLLQRSPSQRELGVMEGELKIESQGEEFVAMIEKCNVRFQRPCLMSDTCMAFQGRLGKRKQYFVPFADWLFGNLWINVGKWAPCRVLVLDSIPMSLFRVYRRKPPNSLKK
jgi:hypothetical protein